VSGGVLGPWPAGPSRPSSAFHLHSSRITLARRSEVSKDLDAVDICLSEEPIAAKATLGVRLGVRLFLRRWGRAFARRVEQRVIVSIYGEPKI
jgi:hypothetical protein